MGKLMALSLLTTLAAAVIFQPLVATPGGGAGRRGLACIEIAAGAKKSQ
jgi:hypothetical protein